MTPAEVLDFNMTEFRSLLKMLSSRLSGLDHRVHCDEMLQFCEDVQTSNLRKSHFDICFLVVLTHACFLVPNGGRIFELYLDLMSSWSSHKIWRSYLAEDFKEDVPPKLDAPRWERILKKERGPFMGFILMATCNIGNKAKEQRFYTTFLAKFYGLSRMGVEALAHFGYLMKTTLYDETVTKVLTTAHDTARFTFDCRSFSLILMKLNLIV